MTGQDLATALKHALRDLGHDAERHPELANADVVTFREAGDPNIQRSWNAGLHIKLAHGEEFLMTIVRYE